MVNARLGKPDGLAMLVLFSLHSNATATPAPAKNNPTIVAKPNLASFFAFILFILTSTKYYKYYKHYHTM
jgi:hypothetical protein